MLDVESEEGCEFGAGEVEEEVLDLEVGEDEHLRGWSGVCN